MESVGLASSAIDECGAPRNFLSLSARDKYLTREERDEFSLGRSEMFERRIIREREWFTFLRTIRKYECAEGAYTGRTGLPMPTKAMVVYWKTNPTNAMLAYFEFQKTMNINVAEALRSGKTKDPGVFTRTNRFLMSEFQRNRGTKHYVDFDLDRNEENCGVAEEGLEWIRQELISKGVQFFVIETKGGWHILMKTSTLKYNFNLTFDQLRAGFGAGFKEVKKNENEMVSLPGTLQADHPVRVLWNLSNFKKVVP